ncbi:hypothetical protein V1505DRAFT_374389 [Lipomyces doorenjongii]
MIPVQGIMSMSAYKFLVSLLCIGKVTTHVTKAVIGNYLHHCGDHDMPRIDCLHCFSASSGDPVITTTSPTYFAMLSSPLKRSTFPSATTTVIGSFPSKAMCRKIGLTDSALDTSNTCVG